LDAIAYKQRSQQPQTHKKGEKEKLVAALRGLPLSNVSPLTK